jgi:hypothetical protein
MLFREFETRDGQSKTKLTCCSFCFAVADTGNESLPIFTVVAPSISDCCQT